MYQCTSTCINAHLHVSMHIYMYQCTCTGGRELDKDGID